MTGPLRGGGKGPGHEYIKQVFSKTSLWNNTNSIIKMNVHLFPPCHRFIIITSHKNALNDNCRLSVKKRHDCSTSVFCIHSEDNESKNSLTQI